MPKDVVGRMGYIGFKGSPDSKVIDVAFGSSRNLRMGGMDGDLFDSSTVDASRCISRTHESVVILDEWDSAYQLAWNIAETFTNPGSCSNIFRRSVSGV